MIDPTTRSELQQAWLEQGLHTTRTFAEELDAGAADHPDTVMVFDSQTRPTTITLGALHARARTFATALQGLGLGRGDVVACQVPNWVEGAVLYHAALSLGIVIVPVVHVYGPNEVGFILRQSRAKALFVPDRWRNIDYLQRLADLGDTPDLEHVVIIGSEAPVGTVRWDDLEARGRGLPELPSLDADDVCVVIYTSGTTAAPKGVRHSHNSLLAEIRGLCRLATGPRVCLSPFPSGHVAGVILLGQAFLAGDTNILVDAWDAGRVADLIEEHQVTWLAATPYFVLTLLEEVRRGDRRLPSLKEIHLGGAGVQPAVVEAADEYGWGAFRSYGSTEHPTVTGAGGGAAAWARAHTDGPPFPGNEVRVVDDEGFDVPTGTTGEVVVRGPEMFLGYSDPALDDEAFLPGRWFRSGDIGRLDDEGCVTIVDRKKDIIIRGGENISSQEVEQVLATVPAVLECAVVAAPDPLYGERVCAFVVLRPGADLSLADVDAHFRAAGVARQKTPERIEVRDVLPRTAAGKVRKADLRSVLVE